MKLVDTNVLVYAIVESSPHHDRSHRWLAAALGGSETILLPWVSLLGFVRIVSNPRLHRQPLDAGVALQLVQDWQSLPQVVMPEPDARHPERMRQLLASIGAAGGNLVNDAHLAALALQHGATVVTFDSDFGRFPDVRWMTPDA